MDLALTAKSINAGHPTLAILVADNLAVVPYFPYAGHPGFVSVSKIETLDPNEFTTFSYDTIEQEQEVINSQVIPFVSALLTAKEFFVSKELPKSLDWFELRPTILVNYHRCDL